MSNTVPPRSYRIIAVVALIWMAFGVVAMVLDFFTDERQLAELDEARRQLFALRPQWVFALYVIATLSGLAGALSLLLRRGWAVPAFAISLVTVVVQFGYILGVMPAIELLGFTTAATFPFVIFAIGAFLLWYSLHAKKKGWFV